MASASVGAEVCSDIEPLGLLVHFRVMTTAPDQPQSELVDVAGLRMQIETDDVGDMALIQRIVGDRRCTGAPDAVIRIGGDCVVLPRRQPDFEGPYGDHWDSGGRHHFWHHWGLSVVVDGHEARLCGHASAHERWVAVRNSMLFVLARLFLERGRFVVHGAAVRQHETGLLIVGDSGTGKSTLTFAAGRAGWHMLADDMVVIDPAGGRPTARGIPRTPSIPGEVATAVGAVGDRVPDDDRQRIELADTELDHSEVGVHGVVVCAHSTGAGSVEPLTPAQALHSLVPAFVLSALPGPVQKWFPTAVQLAHGPSAELRHAVTLETRLAGSSALLNDVLRLVDSTTVTGPDHSP